MVHPAGSLPVPNADCEAGGDVEFICNVISPEDVVAVPYTDLVIASGYQGGGIHLISTRDHTRLQLFPTDHPRLRPDTETYPSCPGPIDPTEGDQFSAHGLSLRPGPEGAHTVYVVHHGFRESIEIFELDTRYQGAVSVSPIPGFTWIGCVIAPEDLQLNSIAPLPGGGFAVTVPFLPDGPRPQEGLTVGEDSGAVWEWHPTDGWAKVPGSESPGPNGIEASEDGRWLYVNLWSGAQVMRLSRGQTPVEKEVVDLSFYPDNIHRQADGSLLAAGQGGLSLDRVLECLNTMCAEMTSNVARIDPQTMEVQDIIDYPANEAFFTATAALQVGNEIWIGSMRGDRIARYPIQ